MQGDRARHEGEEARPAGATVKLGIRAKQQCTSDEIDISAGALLIQMRACEEAFGALLIGDPLLSRGQ